jgi:hypothetical protein
LAVGFWGDLKLPDPASRLAAAGLWNSGITRLFFCSFHIRLQIPMLDLTIHPSKKPEDF